MGKSRPSSPGSALTTSSIKTGPGGRRYESHIEKSQPKYSFRVDTKTETQMAIPDEVELNAKHFRRWPGVLKLAQLIVAILCMIFFSPPLTWFTRILCGVVAICFAVTIFICLFYLFTLSRVVFPSWPWLRIETIYTNVASISYLVSSVLQIIWSNKEEYKISLRYHDYYHDYVVAGAIGIINFILYALGGHLLSKRLKRHLSRQPKVCIIRTTLDRKGKPVKRTVTERKEIIY